LVETTRWHSAIYRETSPNFPFYLTERSSGLNRAEAQHTNHGEQQANMMACLVMPVRWCWRSPA
jgi:hypothetical protein